MGVSLAKGMLLLILYQLAGEFVRTTLGLPLPGPVIGMFLLAATLIVTQRRDGDQRSEPMSDLDTVAGALIRHMGLLFVPAGVGILSVLPLLKGSWLAAAMALVGSTLLSLVATGLAMHWWIAYRSARADGASPS